MPGKNLEAQLKAAGMTLDNLVKVTTILPNHGDVAAAAEKPLDPAHLSLRHQKQITHGEASSPRLFRQDFRRSLYRSFSTSSAKAGVG